MIDDILIKLDIAREDDLEDEIGGPWTVVEEYPFGRPVDRDYTYVVIETETGRYVARLSDRHADARLVIEPEDEALDTANVVNHFY